MTLAQLIPLAINLSMGLVVLALGLNAKLDDAAYLLRRPGLLARSILAMNVIMAVFAAVVVVLFDLHPAVKIAIVALALSPVPPILPAKQMKAGGTVAYTISLLVVAAALALLVVPAGVALIGRAFNLSTAVPESDIIRVVLVLVSVIAPLIIGLLIRQFSPAFAERIVRPVSLFATILLIVSFLPVLIADWRMILSVVGDGALLALAIFTVVGVIVGHLLGGPDPDDRTVLGIATGTRHPGVALAIAGATFPEEKAVLAVVLWHLIVGAIVSIPYVNWRTKGHSTQP